MTIDAPAPPIPATATRRPGTGTVGTLVLGCVTLAALLATAVLGLAASPADAVQQDAVRLMYVHVPSAWLAYLSFGVTALASALYLWRATRAPKWDVLAGASAEIGVVFTGLTLATGMIWGRATWGVYWTWDARLTTTALLFVLFIGYLALREVGDDPEVRARRSAIAALIAFVDVPVVHQSVEWWKTLHQEPTLLRRDLDPQIHGLMLAALLTGVLAFTLLYAWLTVHRYRLGHLQARIAEAGLAIAIAERQAEASRAAHPPAPSAPAMPPATPPAPAGGLS